MFSNFGSFVRLLQEAPLPLTSITGKHDSEVLGSFGQENRPQSDAMMARDWGTSGSADYSEWLPRMDTKIKNVCGALDYVYKYGRSSTKEFSAAMEYMRSLQDSSNIEKLAELGNHNSKPYLGAKAGVITLFVLAVLFVIIAAIVAIVSAKRNGRSKLSKMIGFCKDRRRLSANSLTKLMLVRYLVLILILVLLPTLAFAVMGCLFGSNMILASNDISCDTWLTLRGQFFGIDGYTLAPDMEGDWKGSYVQFNDLMGILKEVTPGIDNPMNSTIREEYRVLKKELDESVALYSKKLDSEINFFNVWAAFSKELGKLWQKEEWFLNSTWTLLHEGEPEPTSSYKRPKDGPVPRLIFDRLASQKSAEYKDILVDTKSEGDVLMANNIEAMLGTNSKMLRQAFDATNNAVIGVADVNYSMASLVREMDKVVDLLGNSMIGLASCTFAVHAITVFGVLVGILVLWNFSKARKVTDWVPTRGQEKRAKVAYIFFLTAACLSAVLGTLMLLIAHIGNDACVLVDKLVLEEGRFDLLMPEVWNATATGQTNMDVVMATCAQRSGDGDIATALGLTAELIDIDATLTRTKEELRRQVTEDLDIDGKKLMAEMINIMYEDLPKVNILMNEAKGKSFHTLMYDDISYISPYMEPPGQELLIVNSLIPVIQEKLLTTLSFVAHDLDFEIRGMNIAIDRLQEWQEGFNFCSPWVSEEMNTTCDGEHYNFILDKDFDPVLLKSVPPHGGCQGDEECQKKVNNVMSLMWSVVTMEKFLNTDIKKFPKWDKILKHGNTYPELLIEICKELDDPTPCYIKDIYRTANPRWVAMGKDLLNNYHVTRDNIMRFLEDITIKTMDDLTNKSFGALENMNCKFLGSALDTAIRRNLCNAAIPSMGFAAIALITSWISTTVGAILFWKIYHYYTDCKAYASLIDRGTTTPLSQHAKSEGLSPDKDVATPEIITPEKPESLPPADHLEPLPEVHTKKSIEEIMRKVSVGSMPAISEAMDSIAMDYRMIERSKSIDSWASAQ